MEMKYITTQSQTSFMGQTLPSIWRGSTVQWLVHTAEKQICVLVLALLLVSSVSLDKSIKKKNHGVPQFPHLRPKDISTYTPP